MPASRAFMMGSAATVLVFLLSLSINSAGVSFGAPTPLARFVAWYEFVQGRGTKFGARG
jgi:hypothetical protein